MNYTSNLSFKGTYALPLNQFPEEKRLESKQKIYNLGKATATCLDLSKQNGVKDNELILNVKPEKEAEFENIAANYGLNIKKL